MKKADCKIGSLCRISGSAAFMVYRIDRRSCLAMTSARQLQDNLVLVKPDDIVLIVSNDDIVDNMYEVIVLFGEQLIFVRPDWIERV